MENKIKFCKKFEKKNLQKFMTILSEFYDLMKINKAVNVKKFKN